MPLCGVGTTQHFELHRCTQCRMLACSMMNVEMRRLRTCCRQTCSGQSRKPLTFLSVVGPGPSLSEAFHKRSALPVLPFLLLQTDTLPLWCSDCCAIPILHQRLNHQHVFGVHLCCQLCASISPKRGVAPHEVLLLDLATGAL